MPARRARLVRNTILINGPLTLDALKRKLDAARELFGPKGFHARLMGTFEDNTGLYLFANSTPVEIADVGYKWVTVIPPHSQDRGRKGRIRVRLGKEMKELQIVIHAT